MNIRALREHFWPLVRFCLVGVGNTLLSYGVYLVLQLWLYYLVAHVLSWYAGVCFSFVMNCYFTYKVKPTWRRFWLFPLSSIPNVVLSSLGVVLLVEWLKVDQRIAPLIATLVAVPISYLLARAILTKEADPDAALSEPGMDQASR